MDLNDNGWASRKLAYTVFTAVLVAGAGLLSMLVLGLDVYTTMVTALVAILSLYLGGNIATKLALGRVLPEAARMPPPADADVVEPDQAPGSL
jgi:hypothetical protein